jgi:hypothetical protein
VTDIIGADRPKCPRATSRHHPVSWVGNRSTGSGSWVCDSCHAVIGKAPVMGTCPGCNTEQPLAESGVCIVCGADSVTPGLASTGPHIA